jgi:hypothetical protein
MVVSPSVNQRLAVVGFNPPLNVKISEYFDQFKVKKELILL